MKLIYCKICGGRMKLKFGIYGYYYSCENFPDCKNKLKCDQESFEVIIKE